MSNYGTVKTIYRQGARPELFTVPSGSYGSNMSFGAGSPCILSFNDLEYPSGQTVSYDAVTSIGIPVFTATVTTKTVSTYRRENDVVIFSINIDLNTDASNLWKLPITDKVVTGTELRIRNLYPITNVIGGMYQPGQSFAPPGTYSRFLPPPNSNFMEPFFIDTEINLFYNAQDAPVKSWNQIQQNVGTEIRSRLLTDDTLALYAYRADESEAESNDEFPITYEILMGNLTTFPSILTRISIRGEYIAS